jgi:hypothetical protein
MNKHNSLFPILFSLIAGLLAACGNGSSGLTTGALFGDAQVSGQPSSPPANDPTARALQVGAVSARAAKCRFYFDPVKLKASFLAAEAKLGATPEQLQKIESDYDYTRLTIAGKIAKEHEYCSDMKTREIKADLARHLAGDYSPPPKKVPADDSWFGLYQAPTGSEVLNPEWIKEPEWANKTKRVEN